ncbi:MAG: sugar ABC transporter substrate-binding protein [Bradymonadales bacterium]|nr:MAG: sugar ABC transporter substrate-binding protein [Bradymonadales bacterium]
MRRSVLTIIILIFGAGLSSGLTAKEGKSIRVAVVLKAKGNAFYDSILDGFQERAVHHGLKTVLHYGENEDDWEGQIKFLIGSLASFDAVVLVPNRSEKFEEVLKELHSSGKPVVIVDTPVTKGEAHVLTTISSDNRLGGSLAGTFMSNQLRVEPSEENCLVHFSGNSEAQTHQDRNRGFLDVVRREHPKMKVYTFNALSDFETAKSIALENLGQIQKCYGVFAGSDTMILGVLDAFESNNLREPPILVGYDAILEVQRKILESKITASVQQSPADMGRVAADSIAAATQGADVQKRQIIAPRLAVRKFQLDLLGEKELAIVSPKIP